MVTNQCRKDSDLSTIGIWSPTDPVPGLDSGHSQVWANKSRLNYFGLDVVYRSSYRYTAAPRSLHGMTIHRGNRLGSDVDIRIMGKDVGLILGMASVYAPLSPCADIEETRFGRLGLQVGHYSLYFSNDFFDPMKLVGFAGTDQSYTGELAIEYRIRKKVFPNIILTGARLRILGTSGIPVREGGTYETGGREFYSKVKYSEANNGAAVLAVSALVDRTPMEFSLTIIDDRIRQWGQGAIHRAAKIPEFAPDSKARSGFFIQVLSEI